MSKLEAIFASRKRTKEQTLSKGIAASHPPEEPPAKTKVMHRMNGLHALSCHSAPANLATLAELTNGGSSKEQSEAATKASHQLTPASTPTPVGIPRVAPCTPMTAPVHLDVGGSVYTATLETLTRCCHSRLALLFNGTIPIVLDSLKQNYFLDRDGPSFRHILNFLRNQLLLLPDDFKEIEILIKEVQYYGLDEMLAEIENWRRIRAGQKCGDSPANSPESPACADENIDCASSSAVLVRVQEGSECGHVIEVTGLASVVEDIFPETQNTLFNLCSAADDIINDFNLSSFGITFNELSERFLSHQYCHQMQPDSSSPTIAFYTFYPRMPLTSARQALS